MIGSGPIYGYSSGTKLRTRDDVKKVPASSKLDINIHSLCTWKDIINYIESEKIYSENEVSNLKEFLEDPDKWRRKYA